MSDNWQPRTNSNKVWIIFFVIVFGIGYLFIQEGIRTGKVKDVFAAPVATTAPAVRAEVVRAEPTIDYQSQIERAEAGQYAAQLEAIAAKQEAVDAKAAQVAAEVVLIQITQQAEQNKILAAQIEITRQANDITLADKNNTAAQLRIEQERVNMEAGARAVENRKNTLLAENAAKFDAKKSQADIFFKTAMPVAIGLLALTLLGWLIWTFLYARYIASQPVAEPEEQPAPAKPIISIHEHKDGGETILRKQPPPCDDDTFQEWAEKMLTGDSAAINAWETADSPFSRKNYPAKYYRRVFWTWITENDIVENDPKDGRLVLSARGREVCEVWKIQHPHSPADEIFPKSASTPAMSMGSMTMLAEGRGVPPMSEPFPGMKGQS